MYCACQSNHVIIRGKSFSIKSKNKNKNLRVKYKTKANGKNIISNHPFSLLFIQILKLNVEKKYQFTFKGV